MARNGLKKQENEKKSCNSKQADTKQNQVTFTCSESTIETLEKGVFIVNLKLISHLFLVFLMLTLNQQTSATRGGTSANSKLISFNAFDTKLHSKS